MPNTASEIQSQFGIPTVECDELIYWQTAGGELGRLATEILSWLESEAASSQWVEQVMDLYQKLNVAASYSGWRITLLLRALDREIETNPCGCPDWGRYCWNARQGYLHSVCIFQDCEHRRQRKHALVDAARQRFYKFDTTAYTRLRDDAPDAYMRLHLGEGAKPEGVRAVAKALLHHQRYQSGRRPNRFRGQLVVDQLLGAAAKFSGPRIFINGKQDMSSRPVEEYLIDRAAEILQRMYPLARTDHRGRLARREQLAQSWMELSGEQHIFFDKTSFTRFKFITEDYPPYNLQIAGYEPMPQCHWHSHRFAQTSLKSVVTR